jgi:hypothetical protein
MTPVTGIAKDHPRQPEDRYSEKQQWRTLSVISGLERHEIVSIQVFMLE